MKDKCFIHKLLWISVAILIVMIAIFLYFTSSNQYHVGDVPEKVSILFLGDFMIGDKYSGSISAPFTDLKVMFENKNEIIVNLETAVTNKTTIGNPGKTYNYKINESVLGELLNNNITILNLANNHVLDFGVSGLNDTFLNIQNYNLSYFGVGYDETQARQGVVRCYRDSTKIGYLSYFEYRGTYDYEYHFYAKENVSGVAELNEHNLESDILRMKEKADIVIVSFHIGENYDVNISDEQKEFARYAVDLGADAVVCHSPHITLPVELYDGKPICYSIGNFIFTTPGRFSKVDELYHVGLGTEFVVRNKKIVSLKLSPFKTNNKVTEYRPCFLNSSEASLLFNTIIPSNMSTTFVDSSIILHL